MAYKYPYENEEKTFKPSKLTTDRRMWKLMLLNILTLGVYSIIFFIPFAFDLDKIHPKRDRSKTFNYLWAYILAFFTMSIVICVWHYQISERIEDALRERKINYDFGTNQFWSCYVLGSLIIVGPYIYMHKLCTAMNLLCEDYNKELESKETNKK